MTRFLPKLTDRAGLFGMTGSGKTTLARKLCSSRPYVVVYDPKRMIRWDGYARYETLGELMHSNHPKLIYAPNHMELVDREKINQFFWWVYERRNTTLYVDEVYSACNRQEIPHYYLACLTQGRELGISVISSSQRPKQIPQFILSESECYYVFRLQLLADKQRIKETIGISIEALNKLPKHEFIFANAEGDIMGPLKLKL